MSYFEEVTQKARELAATAAEKTSPFRLPPSTLDRSPPQWTLGPSCRFRWSEKLSVTETMAIVNKNCTPYRPARAGRVKIIRSAAIP